MARKPRCDESYLRRHSPWRSPSWRWDWAGELATRQNGCKRSNDAVVDGAADYRRGLARVTGAAALAATRDAHPALAAAHALHEHAGVLREEVEARLLCQTVSEVAASTALEPEVVQAFAAVFFDVADAVGRGATAWLITSVVRVGPWCQSVPTEAQAWKYVALAAGPLVLDHLISDRLGRPVPAHPERAVVAARARLMAREAATPWTREGSAAVATQLAYETRQLNRPARNRAGRGHGADKLLAPRLAILRMAGEKRSRRVKAMPSVQQARNELGRAIAPHNGVGDGSQAQAAGEP